MAKVATMFTPRHVYGSDKLSSTWYCKPTDTGLIMNFYALAPSIIKDLLWKVLCIEFTELAVDIVGRTFMIV